MRLAGQRRGYTLHKIHKEGIIIRGVKEQAQAFAWESQGVEHVYNTHARQHHHRVQKGCISSVRHIEQWFIYMVYSARKEGSKGKKKNVLIS